jgi:hypothetical protein
VSNTKYEFVPGDEKVIAPGRTVKRIRSLVANAAFGLPAGALGGYIESEKCLDVSGNAWVSGDAQVYGNARVYGDGLIFWASKVGTQNGTLTVFNTKDGLFASRGCFLGTIDDFLQKSEREHDDATHLEYRLLIEVAHSRITRALAATKEPA